MGAVRVVAVTRSPMGSATIRAVCRFAAAPGVGTPFRYAVPVHEVGQRRVHGGGD
jgi:hypothetical protein